MSTTETWLFWLTTALYTGAAVAFFAGIAWRGDRPARVADVLGVAGCAAHVATLIARWSFVGRFPYSGPYEGSLFGALLVVGVYLAGRYVWPITRAAGLLVYPAAIVTLGYGIAQASAANPVGEIYDSPWLGIHFTFSWATYAVYAYVAGLAAAHLWRVAMLRLGRPGLVPAWIPEAARIDEISLPLVGFAFLLNGVSIASGSIWAYRLWGSYWSWDPVETWSLVTWLAYGFYLHARLTLGWRGTRLAWVALLALVGSFMATWGVQLAPTTYHIFGNLGGASPTARP